MFFCELQAFCASIFAVEGTAVELESELEVPAGPVAQTESHFRFHNSSSATTTFS